MRIKLARRLSRLWNLVKTQAGQLGDPGKVLIEREERHVLFQGDCGNYRVDSGQADAPPTGEAENARGGAISRQPARLHHLPHRQKTSHLFDCASKALRDLAHDNARECKGFPLGNQATQFRPCRARR